MTADLLDTLVQRIDTLLPDAASLRRAIHSDPHLGGDEGDTRDAIRELTAELKEKGIRSILTNGLS